MRPPIAALAAALLALPAHAQVPVVAAEQVYGNLTTQIAGPAATVTAILRNPAQDPHLFEAAPATARAIATAHLVIANGAGYDPWISTLLAASPSTTRITLTIADLVHAPPGGNPHLWYAPATMRAALNAITGALLRLAPRDAATLTAGAARASARLDLVDAKVAALRARFAGQAIAATEPVFGPMAAALGLTMRDARFQLAVMNGTEPRASDIAAIEADLRTHRIRALLTNAQVSDPATQRLLAIAKDAGIPVVGVTETEPPGDDYAAWMLAELGPLEAALDAPPT
jgi:zinc/manganese transport system substrate-binding protein